ncbi:MAG: BhlA/UviB family holin-like peptide [Clostridia bacterium]|jgi:hypothetical protein|nr:BhlA/UviB family holin-like peptide [Clostridia bacterium]
MQELINVVISNGIFATLFVALLYFQLKDSSQREKKYIAVIEKFSKQLDAVEDVKENISKHFDSVDNVSYDISKQSEAIENVKQDISEIKNVIYFNNTIVSKGKKDNKKQSNIIKENNSEAKVENEN